MIKKMITKKIINSDFIIFDDGVFTINPYFEFRYMANVFDFEKTKCRCGLFKIFRFNNFIYKLFTNVYINE